MSFLSRLLDSFHEEIKEQADKAKAIMVDAAREVILLDEREDLTGPEKGEVLQAKIRNEFEDRNLDIPYVPDWLERPFVEFLASILADGLYWVLRQIGILRKPPKPDKTTLPAEIRHVSPVEENEGAGD